MQACPRPQRVEVLEHGRFRHLVLVAVHSDENVQHADAHDQDAQHHDEYAEGLHNVFFPLSRTRRINARRGSARARRRKVAATPLRPRVELQTPSYA